jgi:hypothetical protein
MSDSCSAKRALGEDLGAFTEKCFMSPFSAISGKMKIWEMQFYGGANVGRIYLGSGNEEFRIFKGSPQYS